MSHKVYYDATNNKEVVDISGNKTDTEIETNHGLTASKQVVQITNPDYAHEVINGVLQTFDAKARAISDATAKETARQQAEDAFKLSLGWTDQQYNDFKASLGL